MHQYLVMAARVQHHQYQVHLLLMQAAVAVAVMEEELRELVAQEEAAMEAEQETEQMELLIQEVARVAQFKLEQAALAAPALLSCPIPCQKAQSFNSCLLRHGKHQ